MDFTALIGIIYELHFTILTDFYIYLQNFQ